MMRRTPFRQAVSEYNDNIIRHKNPRQEANRTSCRGIVFIYSIGTKSATPCLQSGADEIIRKYIAFVDVAAYGADKAFFCLQSGASALFSW